MPYPLRTGQSPPSPYDDPIGIFRCNATGFKEAPSLTDFASLLKTTRIFCQIENTQDSVSVRLYQIRTEGGVCSFEPVDFHLTPLAATSNAETPRRNAANVRYGFCILTQLGFVIFEVSRGQSKRATLQHPSTIPSSCHRPHTLHKDCRGVFASAATAAGVQRMLLVNQYPRSLLFPSLFPIEEADILRPHSVV